MKFYMTLIIAMLGVSLITSTLSANDKIEVEETLGFSRHVVAMTPAQEEINYTEMVEDLKVMCRIIDETMNEAFKNDYVKGGFFRRGGCQHLYLKGYGPMFLLDVRFPVAEKEMKIVKTEKETNLWEKHEREVRHQSHPEEAAWVVDKNESYSKEKVDKLKEQLAYLVGEYGSRIGQLTLDDTISFVVFGYPDYAVDLETDFLVEMHVVEPAGADAMSHAREALEGTRETVEELRETITEKEKILKEIKETVAKIKELEEKIASQDSGDDADKIIIQKDKTIIVEEETAEEMEDSESKKGRRLHLRIPGTPIIPPPPTPISVPHRFRGKPATTLVLSFKRSQLEGKKGADWEALLKAAEVVEY